MGDTSKVTRFEIINHMPCPECMGDGVLSADNSVCSHCEGRGTPGRVVIAYGKEYKFSAQIQDEGRTLKVFIHERYPDKI